MKYQALNRRTVKSVAVSRQIHCIFRPDFLGKISPQLQALDFMGIFIAGTPFAI
ncbi:hypothetical protein [Massilia sp. BJB1822]|uniref:hypothetical protein n=1 Tax=Massilia sp. BJB1822 TaxID=2744470 RepID=UPI0015932C40|nr:hypothetical protein [Massilia sp. BJB1822]NVD98536.1 hypothetical protein [Massilia sp. BJB1822]